MFQYFRGWKRKAGLFMLVLTCVLTAGWLRSYLTQDLLQIPNGRGSTIQVVSAYSTLMFIEVTSDSNEEQMKDYGLHSFPLNDPGRVVRFGNNMFLASHDEIPIDSFSPRIGTRLMGPSEFIWEAYQIPYWSIVAPLTIASAWLLLSKRRQPTKTEPFPELVA